MANIIKRSKDSRVDLRISPEEKDLLEKAASMKGLTLSSYLIYNSLEAARRDIENYHKFILSDDERDLFLSLMENPPEPNPALKSAMKRFQDEYER